MVDPILYVSQCPVCDQGLVRIRTFSQLSHVYSICQCDECDASWKSPTLAQRISRIDVDRMTSDCTSSHWSSLEEICLFGWAGFIRPNQSINGIEIK